MASVWLARDETLHREVAIKLMADTLADDERWLARFKREARAAAALSHPHIVKVFDFGIEEHRPYLVMAHVPGGSLRDRIRDGGELPDAERLARELLGALAHVHAAGIVHRDVKPGNILLDEHDRSQLTDFGIARPQDARDDDPDRDGAWGRSATSRPRSPRAGRPPSAATSTRPAACCARSRARTRRRGWRELLDALTDEDPGERPSSADDALATARRAGTRRACWRRCGASEQPERRRAARARRGGACDRSTR